MRSIKTLFVISSVIFTFTHCDSVTDPNIETEPGKKPVTAPLPAVIKQVADTIQGKQATNSNFLLSDYFESEAAFVQTEFSSESVSIEEAGSEIFVISQPDSLHGTQTIQAFLVNSDSDTLQTSLEYIIEADSALSDSSGEEEETEEPADGKDNSGDEGSGDDSGDDGSGNDEDNSNNDDTEQPEPADLVIMPLGDSMTNDSRSRVTLWNLLVADTHTVDYVGNQYQQSSIPDADHEGVGGIKIDEVAAKVSSLMNTHKPEYINLMIGTNDIAWYFDETATEIATRWNSLVQKIYDNSAEGTYVVAATIPPVTPKNVGKSGMEIQDRAEMVKAYNKEIRQIVAERKAAGDNIVLADMEAALNLSSHVSGDGVHLNDSGYATMGTVYYKAITSVLK